MRRTTLFLAVAASLSASMAARACDPIVTACLPALVVFPAHTAEGLRVGTVAARVAEPPALEPSRYTGQPRTVVFNDPGNLPDAVDPELTLMRLPRVRLFDTQGAYPSGY